jgi:hypothetical protein
VGGGPDQYVTVKFDGAGNAYTLINPAPMGTKRIELCAGGQPGDFTPDIVCSFPTVAEAVDEFFASPSTLTARWRQDQFSS